MKQVALLLFLLPIEVLAAPSFVQLNYADPQSSVSSVNVSYKNAQTAGNANIVAVGWNDTTHSISSVRDSLGNAYVPAAAVVRSNGMSQALFYAANIKGGPNAVKVVFSGRTRYVDVRIAEYKGLAASSPLLASTAATGKSTLAVTPNISLNSANSLLFAAGITLNSFNAAGTGYQKRVITNPDGDIVEDRIASSAGSYNASASLASGAYILQLAAFQAAAAPVTTDTSTGTSTGMSTGSGTDTGTSTGSNTVGPVMPVGQIDGIACSGVQLSPGANIQNAVNANPSGTTFCLAAGTYAQQSVQPKAGDKFIGARGAILDGKNATARAFDGGANNVWIQNLVIQNYTAGNQDAPIFALDVTGWTVKNTEVRYNAGEGIIIGDGMTVQACYLHHNLQAGFGSGGPQGTGMLFDSNEVAFNNYTDAFDPGFEAGGGKFWASQGLVVTHNYVHDNHGPGLWDDTDNNNITYAYNRVENNWGGGIFHEIGYNASIHDNVLKGNANTKYCSGWLWCGDIQIAGSGGVNGGMVEIYNNSVAPNGAQNGNAISLIQQNRGSGALGTYLVQNVYVHDNTVDLSGGGGSGGVEDVNSLLMFTSRNNRFDRNTYILGTNTSPFEWNDRNGGKSFWQGYGLDVNGTFK